MQLVFMCKSCKNYSKVVSKATNRYDLRDDLGGEEVRLQCDNCQSSQTMHINRIIAQQATSTGLLVIVGVLSAIALLTILLLNVGFISTATFALPLVFYFTYRQQQEKAIAIFNKVRL